MSDTTTAGIRVQVEANWWEERSQVEAEQWAFTYTVTITNVGTEDAMLHSRHWVITDASGHVEEVRGDGVIGKQPVIKPGETFEYTSWAMLRTPFGTMRGEYFMERNDGRRFEVKIGEFVLTQPNALN